MIYIIARFKRDYENYLERLTDGVQVIWLYRPEQVYGRVFTKNDSFIHAYDPIDRSSELHNLLRLLIIRTNNFTMEY
jgi:hypothetical protein